MVIWILINELITAGLTRLRLGVFSWGPHLPLLHVGSPRVLKGHLSESCERRALDEWQRDECLGGRCRSYVAGWNMLTLFPASCWEVLIDLRQIGFTQVLRGNQSAHVHQSAPYFQPIGWPHRGPGSHLRQVWPERCGGDIADSF